MRRHNQLQHLQLDEILLNELHPMFRCGKHDQYYLNKISQNSINHDILNASLRT